MIRYAFIGFIFLASLSACDRSVLVSEKWDWKDHHWLSADRKSIVMEAVDTTTVYQMDVDLVHAESYGFQNLYIQVSTTYPSGKEITSVTSLELINADGSWAGDCSGKSCSITLPLQRRFTFPETGKYTWSVEPFMRMDTVQGINSLRVTCRKVKP